MRRLFACVLGLALLPSAANAVAIYRFETFSSVGLSDVFAEFVFTDAAFASGSDWGTLVGCEHCFSLTPGGQLGLLSYSLAATDFTGGTIEFSGGTSVDPVSNGFLDYSFLLGPTLSGFLHASNDDGTDQAEGFDFGVDSMLIGFGSDSDTCYGPQSPTSIGTGIEGQDNICRVTGAFRLVTQVPAPGGLPFLLIGALGVLVHRLGHLRHHRPVRP